MSHVAEQFSWVPLPTALHPGALSQWNLLLCQHVSPRTIHFWVLGKSPVSGPRGLPLPATIGLNPRLLLSFAWQASWATVSLPSLDSVHNITLQFFEESCCQGLSFPPAPLASMLIGLLAFLALTTYFEFSFSGPMVLEPSTYSLLPLLSFLTPSP